MSRKLALGKLSSFTLAFAVGVTAALAQGKPPSADAGTPKAEATPGAAAPAAAAPAATAPAAGAPAAAAPAPAATGVKADAPCKEDIEVFCANVQAGGGRIYQCLAAKETELSNTCKARIADLRATGGECKDDIQKFCASVPRARGRLAKCLTEHHDELSEGCKTLSARAKGVPSSTSAPAAAAAVKPPEPAPAAAPDAGAR